MSDEAKPSSQENSDKTACYANPEPPPEIQRIQQDDLIGNTMFSKHWVFGVLLQLIEVRLRRGLFRTMLNEQITCY